MSVISQNPVSLLSIPLDPFIRILSFMQDPVSMSLTNKKLAEYCHEFGTKLADRIREIEGNATYEDYQTHIKILEMPENPWSLVYFHACEKRMRLFVLALDDSKVEALLQKIAPEYTEEDYFDDKAECTQETITSLYNRPITAVTSYLLLTSSDQKIIHQAEQNAKNYALIVCFTENFGPSFFGELLPEDLYSSIFSEDFFEDEEDDDQETEPTSYKLSELYDTLRGLSVDIIEQAASEIRKKISSSLWQSFLHEVGSNRSIEWDAVREQLPFPNEEEHSSGFNQFNLEDLNLKSLPDELPQLLYTRLPVSLNLGNNYFCSFPKVLFQINHPTHSLVILYKNFISYIPTSFGSWIASLSKFG